MKPAASEQRKGDHLAEVLRIAEPSRGHALRHGAQALGVAPRKALHPRGIVQARQHGVDGDAVGGHFPR